MLADCALAKVEDEDVLPDSLDVYACSTKQSSFNAQRYVGEVRRSCIGVRNSIAVVS